MPTVITKTLGNGGASNSYDYGDFNAFAAAVPSNLVTADEQWILEVHATHGEISLTSAQSVTGKTTDSTRNIIIRAASGQSFNDHANKATNALRYNASNGAAITNSSNAGWYVVHDFGSVSKIEGIQLRGTSSSPHTLINVGGDIDRCIIECATSAYENACIRATRLINTVAYVVATTGYVERLVRLPWDSGASSRITSSTLYSLVSGFTAIVQPGGGAQLKSSAVFGFSTLYTNDGSGGSLSIDHSATDLSSMSGTANLTSQTTSSQFESVGTLGTLDLRVKTGAGLINAGDRDQTYTADLDILEQTRSTSTPTIGAFEYGAGGGGASATITATTTPPAFSGSAQVVLETSITVTTTLPAFSGGASSGTAEATITATTALPSFSGSATGDTSSGVLTLPILKNNTGTVLANETGATVHVYEVSTGNKVVTKTGQTTNGSGVMTVTDALIVAATQYRVVVVLGSGAEGLDKVTAA